MCVACAAAVWWSVENGEIIKDRLHKDIFKVIKEKYGRGATGATDLIVDAIQKDFACCGVKGPSDWAESMYNLPNSTRKFVDYGIPGNNAPSGLYKVPQSCCVKEFVQCEKVRLEVPLGADSRLNGIYKDGCSSKIDKYIELQWKWLIIVAGVLISVQFFALIFACFLCICISRDEDK